MEKIEFEGGFSLEEITDKSMGLIQNSCGSNAPSVLDINALEMSDNFKNIIG